jgi:hypothetical protein
VLLNPENRTSHSFPHTIWRTIPSPLADHNQWALELRDPVDKKVTWALLDVDLPGIKWISSPESTDWWTTLTAFDGANVYLHNYRFPDIPEPTDLLAISAESGTLVWVLPGTVFVTNASDTGPMIVARKVGEGVRYYQCDAARGAIKDVATPVTDPALSTASSRMPIRYEPGDVYFETVSSFLCKTAGIDAPIAIDYLEANPYIVFSYYIYQHEKVAQYLLIVNRQKQIVHQELLCEDRQGIGRDTILWKNNILICLRNNNELISIKLMP